ncbi:MAG: GPW/gp25 family protein [Bacteroidota bacterium]
MPENSFLGQGWSFPPMFNRETGTVTMAANEQDIDQSLEILLSTSLGERVMQPDYGCNLKDYQFEPLNNGLIGYLKDLVETAILLYEPRITLEKIEVTPLESEELIEGRFKVLVDYRIAETNSRYNFVYDFYLREADASPI